MGEPVTSQRVTPYNSQGESGTAANPLHVTGGGGGEGFEEVKIKGAEGNVAKVNAEGKLETTAAFEGTLTSEVEGKVAVGAAVSGKPFQMAAKDPEGNVALLKLNEGGFLEVSPSGFVASGGAAIGAGNPVLVGAEDTEAKIRTLKTDTSGRAQVTGATAPAAVAAGNPVQVSGVDAEGKVRRLLTNAEGKLETTVTASSEVQGTVAVGAAVSGKPFQIAGEDPEGNVARIKVIEGFVKSAASGFAAAGAAAIGAGNPLFVGGEDTESKVRALRMDTSGRAAVVGGTAPATVAAGNPVQVSGVDAEGKVRRLLTNAEGKLETVGGGGGASEVEGKVAVGAEVGASKPLVLGAIDSESKVRRLLSVGGFLQTIASGNAASGAAAAGAGNPIMMGGEDAEAKIRSFKTDTSGRGVVVGAAPVGAAITGNPILIGVSDGTNVRALKSNSEGKVEGLIVNEPTARVSKGAEEVGGSVGASFYPVQVGGVDEATKARRLQMATGNNSLEVAPNIKEVKTATGIKETAGTLEVEIGAVVGKRVILTGLMYSCLGTGNPVFELFNGEAAVLKHFTISGSQISLGSFPIMVSGENTKIVAKTVVPESGKASIALSGYVA